LENINLNEEQLLAVQHCFGKPAIVVSGAGSGKTRVLTERVRYLMNSGISPKKICAVTFTNKAALEMTTRLGLDDQTPRDLCPKVSTIHSLALSAIRRNPKGFGLQDRVSPLDDYDQSQMMKKLVERRKFEINPYFVLEQISYHRARGVGFYENYTPEVHAAALVSHAGYHCLSPEAQQLWQDYEREKAANSVVDFDDMLLLCIRRMETDSPWCTIIQHLFEHVLCDEAQDCSPTHWKFLTGLMAPDNYNFYIVGDVNQSIYSFNGAAPNLMIDFSQGWRNKVPSLYRIGRNHRSVPEIIRMANAIQAKMTMTLPLKMEAWRGTLGDAAIRTFKASMPSDIAKKIVEEIYAGNRRKTDPITYRENCILIRSKMQIRDLEAELVRWRVPYIIRGGQGLLATEEVRDILAYLRLATNPNDYMALTRAVAAPKRGIGNVALEKIRFASKDYEDNLIKAAEAIAPTKLQQFLDVINVVVAAKDTPIQAIDAAISLSRYREYIADKYKKDQQKVVTKLENLERLKELIASLVENGGMSTEDVVFQLTMDRADDKTDEGKVTVSTIHSAKGLEWRRVYLTNLYEGSLPHKWSMNNEEEIEEERRLWYVAVTRAKDQLILCIPGLIQMGPNTNVVAPSRFLFELGIN
jgi:superfamily I DNA/RNA helicase